jgi:predicted Ser/Thr protein kinase
MGAASQQPGVQVSIAHYRLLARLGAGGMGEVWRALDTRLNREVAIKILPEAFASDPDRRARFEREAQVLAALNHPNIAQVYGFEERALVMELVNGETLAGPVPLDTALGYADQIAGALESAHEKGIVHRDLKPANIMVTPSGVVKVLDFGLARMADPVTERTSDVANSPTLTISATRAGMILGTARHMAPEQARGKVVDKRADIWAFGCVLYEMLAGKPLFEGETISDILASVIKEEPDLSALSVPDHIRGVIAKCLRKDPQTRWRDIGDVRMALNEAPGPAATQPSSKTARVAWAAAVVMSILAVALALAFWRGGRAESPRPFMSLSVDLGPDAIRARDITLALSPDGTRVVFPIRTAGGGSQLAIRSLAQSSAQPLPGTDGAAQPFFSPDGEWVGFFAADKVQKVSVRGGDPITIASAMGGATPGNLSNGRGGTWSPTGDSVFAPGSASGLSRVPEQGGEPRVVTTLQTREGTHRWPQFLPGGKAVLFTASANRTDFAHGTVEAVSLPNGQRKVLVRDAFFGRGRPRPRHSEVAIAVHRRKRRRGESARDARFPSQRRQRHRLQHASRWQAICHVAGHKAAGHLDAGGF